MSGLLTWLATDASLIVLLAAGALLAALALPWFIARPAQWFFYAIMGLSLFGITDSSTGSSIYKQLTWGTIFAFAAFAALRTADGHWRFPKFMVPPALALLLAFLFVSCAWSHYPFTSFKRAMEMLGILLVAIALMRREGTGIADLLQKPFIVYLLIGLAMALLVPHIAFASDHALRAMTSQKNTWGEFSLIGCIVFLTQLLQSRRRRTINAAVLLLSIISLLASRSMTSIVAFFAVACLALAWRLVETGHSRGWFIAMMAFFTPLMLLIGYALLQNESPWKLAFTLFFEATDRTRTLTGRTFLWQLILEQIHRHPWFGAGYGGFWVYDGKAYLSVIHQLDWGPPSQAHDGYLDILNDIGIVGFVLFLGVIIAHLRNLYALYRLHLKDNLLFHIALIAAAIIINFAESSFIRYTDLWWLLVCASIVEVHVRLQRARLGCTRC